MPSPFARASNARACFDCLKKLLSRDVFEQRYQFVLLIVFSYMQTICQNIWVKTLPKKAKYPLLGDLRCSETSLLKLPVVSPYMYN